VGEERNQREPPLDGQAGIEFEKCERVSRVQIPLGERFHVEATGAGGKDNVTSWANDGNGKLKNEQADLAVIKANHPREKPPGAQ
jgi:hypothetical protein